MVFNTSTSLFWKMFLYLISSFAQGVSLHSSMMCFWVSGEILQYLHVVFFWNLFFFCSFSRVALMFWFLWWHYIPFCWAFLGIPAFCWWMGFSLFSHQCFVIVLFSASSWVLFLVISIICLFMLFFISFFEHFAICSFTLNSSRIPLVLSIQVLFSCCVIFLISGFFFILISLWACMILFFLMISSITGYPISLRRMVVGVPCGRNRIVFRASLKIVCVFSISSLV